MPANGSSGPRAIALIGPYQSGKTSLFESMLALTGRAHRKSPGQRFAGDQSPEAKDREMGVELNIASADFMDSKFFLLDCPGSIELYQETLSVLPGVDAAVIVIEPEEGKVAGLAPIMKSLEDRGIPRFIFVNKIDRATGSVQGLVSALQGVSEAPVILRHLPVRKGEEVTGYIDLMHERAYAYGAGGASSLVDLPEDEQAHVEEARYQLLETLADFDDHLMEELLEDEVPPIDEVIENLAKDTAGGHVVPVLLGSAINDNGVTRLLKALRHEAPGIKETCERLGVDAGKSDFLGLCLKTFHTAHGGKRSITRVLRGKVNDGDSVNGERISGIVYVEDADATKRTSAVAGDVVALGRLEEVSTGEVLTANGKAEELPALEVLPPVYDLALGVDNRSDEVKLSTSLAKVCDEDPSLSYAQTEDTHQLILHGQGEMHLKIAIDRLKNRYALGVTSVRPKVPYKETIRRGKQQHSRFKKQTGGHGQFGDVVVQITPLGRGEGFTFEEKIHGGSIPRQYIPSVEHGVRDYLNKGPLGFPVVDLSVVLLDGKYHAVDSSDMAFQTAGRMAMSEALPDCQPVLLEPIVHVTFYTPSDFTAKVNGLVTTRRGQILGFDARNGWSGWDQVEAHMPQSEIHDMIIELRSMTAGAGSYVFEFDHLAELTGRLADQVVEAHRAED